MSEKRKVIRVYDKVDSDADEFNKKIKEAEDDGWQVTGMEYSVSEGKADCFIAYLEKREEKTVAQPPEPHITDLPFRAVTFLDAFTKSWCIDEAASTNEGDLLFRCHRCPFNDEGYCDVKRFKNYYAPGFENFGAMSR